jgi:acyl CoA:acetate/3-ketoacid CoA transferase alpha subunit
VTAAARRIFSQQIGQGEIVMPFYDNGRVRIRYEEAGSGFPLLLVPGGGLNSTIDGLKRGVPFNAIEEFTGSIAVSSPTCATPMAVSPPGRSSSTGHGMPTPMTKSV